MTPRRRWFAFRLRTLSVAVAMCAALTWVAHSLIWIRERRTHISADPMHQVGVFVDWCIMDTDPVLMIPQAMHSRAPGWLFLFGEEGVRQAAFFGPDELRAEAARVFPEARITFYTDPLRD